MPYGDYNNYCYPWPHYPTFPRGFGHCPYCDPPRCPCCGRAIDSYPNYTITWGGSDGKETKTMTCDCKK